MILSDIEQNQTETIERELLTEESWRREFIGYIANTFIGDVKLGEHQYQKLLAKGREDTWNYIKPTLGKKAGILGNSITDMKAFYLFQKLWKEMINYDGYEHCNIL